MVLPASRRLRWCLALAPLLLAWLAVTAPARAQDATVLTADGYWTLVAETEAEVEALLGAPATEQQQALAALAERWSGVTIVALPDGSRLPLEQEWFVALLRAEGPQIPLILAHLQALQSARQAWPEQAAEQNDLDRSLAQLDQILSRPEFQWVEQEPTLLQRLWQRLLRLLFAWLPAGEGNLLLSYGLTALGALTLLAVLLYAARSLFGGFASEAQGESLPSAESGLNAEDALNRAQALSQGGDYRAAVRYLYLSTLLLLDDRGLLRYDRSRTNREYLRSVADRPELAGTLRSVVDVFDRTWYGYQALDAETYALYEKEVNALRHGGKQR